MTYPAAQTFWLEPTEQRARGLRRYGRTADGGWDCAGGYHHALIYIDRVPATYSDGDFGRRTLAPAPQVPRDDRRWPTHCVCGYQFTEGDAWQTWSTLIYRRTDTGTEHVLHTDAPDDAPTAPPGATWDAWWLPDCWRGPDGIALMVRLPNGRDWAVDSEASNCTRKGEPHACWVRHGDPRECRVTVDKAGDTCTAGAGSILVDDYHGFLQGGVLTEG